MLDRFVMLRDNYKSYVTKIKPKMNCRTLNKPVPLRSGEEENQAPH